MAKQLKSLAAGTSYMVTRGCVVDEEKCVYSVKSHSRQGEEGEKLSDIDDISFIYGSVWYNLINW